MWLLEQSSATLNRICQSVYLFQLASDGEDDALAEIDHPVTSAFQVVGGPQQVIGLFQAGRLCHDEGSQFGVYLIVQCVNFIIVGWDGAGGVYIAFNVGMSTLSSMVLTLSAIRGRSMRGLINFSSPMRRLILPMPLA